MKVKELRQLPETEWDQKLNALRKELYGLRSRAQTGKLDNPSQIRFIRRDIARLMTLQSEAVRTRKKGGG